jgi:hypothetical protein
MAKFHAGLLLLVASACGPSATTAGTPMDGGGTVDAAFAYDSIDVEPPTATLTVGFTGVAMQSYRVYGVKAGAKTEITTTCHLAIDASFGTSTGATVTVGGHGGATTVTANCAGQTGTAALVVKLTGAVVVGMAPANAATMFGTATAGTDTTRVPHLEYPADGAVTPRNIPPIEAQWTTAGNDLFHVSLTSPYVAVDVYTTAAEAALSDSQWTSLTDSVFGGPIDITVEGMLRSAPTTRFASRSVRLNVARDTIDKTAIYYWASSKGSLMTQTFGDTGAPDLVKDDCTSCHSVSRAGSRLGYSRCVGGDCGQLFAGFMKYDKSSMSWKEVVNADNKTIHGSYTVFAPQGTPFPDDTKSVAIVSMIDGTLALYDPDTGNPVQSNLNTVSTHGPGAPRSGLMADWSADGSRIVFASTPHPGQWIDLSDGLIATMSYHYANGVHTFGEPEFLISQPIMLNGKSYSNLFFPSFSPDGTLVVFDAARDSWRNFTVAASAGQRLMLAAANGAWTVDLTALNGGTDDGDVTWPHWAPGDTTDYYWVVFSSERNYGHEVTAANSAAPCVANGVKQCKQLWIGAIDKRKVMTANMPMDPSAPAIWLPGQDTQADNISPYWTVPVDQIP